MSEFDWNDKNIAQLRAFWADGYSAKEIARRLGTSKNSVVGKVHRLGLEPRPSPINNGYSDEQKARFIELWERGESNIAIATEFGMSRDHAASWCAYWVNTLDLRKRAAPKRGCKTLPALPSGAPDAPVIEIIAAAPVTVFRERAARGCAWVGGDRRPWTYCDARAVRGAYCAAHAEGLFVATQRRIENTNYQPGSYRGHR